MPQQQGGESPERSYAETVAPENPPAAVVRPEARSAALVTFLGGIVLLFLLIGAALIFWKVTDRPGDDGGPAPIGTMGEPRSKEAPGGFEPAPQPGSTREELEYRGAGDSKKK